MSMTKDLLRELSQPDLKREGNNSKFSFEKLSNSKRIFTEPVFELPKPKNLKLEAACLELVNLRYHAGKIKNRISDSIHVSAMDPDEFLPLVAPVGWGDLRRGFLRSDEDWQDLNKRIRVELLYGIDLIINEISEALVSNCAGIDQAEFPFLKLSQVEQSIVAYMLTPDKNHVRQRVLGSRSYYRNSEDLEVSRIISALSDRFTEVEIRNALEPDNTLISENFVLVDLRDLADKSWDKVDLALNHSKVFPMDGNASFFNSIQIEEVVSPTISLSDLEIPVELREQIVGLMSLYKKGKISPLSFLFFGKSGSGKTSLVNAIARELGIEVVIVRDYLSSEKHLPSIVHFLMRKYKHKKVLILFDECENLWYDNSSIFERSQSRSKEKNWSKHLLENPNGVVAFTSNFAPPAAFLRRVTLAAELSTPNDEVRAKILVEKSRELCEKLKLQCGITIDDFKSLSQSYDLTGAFLERAVTLSLVYSEEELTKCSLEKALQSISVTSGGSEVEGSMEDRGLVLSDEKVKVIETVKNILERKKKNIPDPLLPKATSLMLHGPPGTGKTEFAKDLSNKLKLKLKMTTASDFLSKYIGESEQNISKIFKQAAKNKEILFIDEVEGLFLERVSAKRSWELTQIGEFLKQIESYDGVLVVATNHKEMIDQAFSRRFIFQVEFSYPKYTERLALLKRFLGENLAQSELEEVARENEFSPGELRNATAIWSVSEDRAGSYLALKIQEQVNMRITRKEKVVGIIAN